MSKGSKRRPTNTKVFSDNFDKIQWNGEFKYVNKKRYVPRKSVHHIMPDIDPYLPAGGDGAWKEPITSRSKEREYLKRNNCVQVGNERDYFFKHNGKTEYNPTKDW